MCLSEHLVQGSAERVQCSAEDKLGRASGGARLAHVSDLLHHAHAGIVLSMTYSDMLSMGGNQCKHTAHMFPAHPDPLQLRTLLQKRGSFKRENRRACTEREWCSLVIDTAGDGTSGGKRRQVRQLTIFRQVVIGSSE